MNPLNRPVSFGPSLVATTLLLALSSLAGAGESVPSPGFADDPAWDLVPGAIAEEIRQEVRSQLRGEMVAALEPTSLVWNGALDGTRLAQEMREEIRSQTPAEMAIGLRLALEASYPAKAPPPTADEGQRAAHEQRLALGRAAPRLPHLAPRP